MNNRWDNIVVLKGIFIFFIVLFHVGPEFEFPYESWFSYIYRYGGTIGNSFFFIISGFMMSHTYRNMIQESKINFPTYIKKRMSKVYPTYFLSTVTILAISGPMNLQGLMMNFLLITSGWIEDIRPINGPCWFLSELLLCYIIYYALVKNVKKEQYIYGCFLLVLWGQILLKQNMQIPFCYTHDGEGIRNFFLGGGIL